MSQKFRNITGTYDILPDAYTVDGTRVEAAHTWRHVENRVRDVLEHYGFAEIRTPIMEPTELIARGIGEMTDIVSKEMFTFTRGETNYVLRPELTAPVIRAYLQHHLAQKGGVQKLYYMGPCFRAERPQKGRYRQFHQFGVEIIGVDDARADAETIAVMMRVYESLGLKELHLRLNTLGDSTSRPLYREALRAYFEPLSEKLSETSRQRLQTNALRILDTKNERERELLSNAPLLSDYIDAASREHYGRVKQLLGELGIQFSEDPFLVRGLDYYTQTAFELESPNLGAQNSLAGGGRYDLLAKEVGSKTAVPAVGFAAGFERLFLALEAEKISFPNLISAQVYIVALGEPAQAWAYSFASTAREAGLRVEFDLLGRSMKAQMREADRQAVSWVVIVGDDELERNEAIVREMATGEQKTVSFKAILQVLRASFPE